MSSFPEIKTKGLLLRRFTEQDIENVFKGLSDPQIIKYYGVSYPTLEATKLQMKYFEDLEKEQSGTWWAICSKQQEVFYGAAGLYNISLPHKKAEIGFWLLTGYWGKGIIKEAMDAVLEYAFKNVGLHRIEAFVETENKNSRTVLGKLGFVHEGTMADAEIKNGQYMSLDIYAKLSEDGHPSLFIKNQ